MKPPGENEVREPDDLYRPHLANLEEAAIGSTGANCANSLDDERTARAGAPGCYPSATDSEDAVTRPLSVDR
jgi:hypothetical protein